MRGSMAGLVKPGCGAGVTPTGGYGPDWLNGVAQPPSYPLGSRLQPFTSW
jgi:hypothetical protein